MALKIRENITWLNIYRFYWIFSFNKVDRKFACVDIRERQWEYLQYMMTCIDLWLFWNATKLSYLNSVFTHREDYSSAHRGDVRWLYVHQWKEQLFRSISQLNFYGTKNRSLAILLHFDTVGRLLVRPNLNLNDLLGKQPQSKCA